MYTRRIQPGSSGKQNTFRRWADTVAHLARTATAQGGPIRGFIVGWFRVEAEAWPELLERLPRPLTRAEALHDLRWMFYQGPSRGRLQSHVRLAERWGWTSVKGKPSKKRVHLLIKSEDWRDTIEDVKAPKKGKEATRRQRGGKQEAAGRQAGGKENGQTKTDDKVRRQAGGSEEAARRQAGGSEGDRRVELPSTLYPLPSTDEDTQEDPLPIPKWLIKWRKTAGDVPRSVTNADLLWLAAQAIEHLTGLPLPKWPPTQGHGRPALNSWRRLGCLEPRGAGLNQLAVLFDAAKYSPDQLFREHIRGVRASGERWKECPRLTAGVVWRMDPPKTSGATIEDRLTAALEWHAAGRPISDDSQALPSFDVSRGEKPSMFIGDIFEARGQAVAGQTQLTVIEPEEVNQPTAVLEMLAGMRRKRP